MKNFKLEKSEYVLDVNSQCFYYKHISGAKILYLKNDDNNSVFTIAFKTLPENNCGIPHIVEHCTLCGSENYRLKDPFNVLSKGIIHTYLNAVTYPDFTAYPVAGTNEQDFYTMVKVYMDAVFKPLMLENEGIFLQEGWHYGEGGINGVVYNEMRGAFSQATKILKHKLQEILYKSTPYQYYSGGIPQDIPNLTYSEFLNYYKEKYHPSNAVIYLYGNIDIEKYFELIDGYISDYTPKIFNDVFDFSTLVDEISFNIENNNKNYLSAIFNTGTATDYKQNLAFTVLDEALFNNNTSALKKELQKMGASVKSEYESMKYFTNLSITVEDSKASLNEFKRTINNFVDNGDIDYKHIKSAINNLKFYICEEDFGYKPKGLYYGLRLISSFLYNSDNFDALKYSELFSYVENVDYKELLKKYLSKGVYGEINKNVQPIKSEPIIKNINTEKLLKYQNTTDTVEELNKISPVKPCDVSKDIYKLNAQSNGNIIYVPIDSDDIVYMDFAFDLSGIREELINYAGIYRYAAQRMNDTLEEKVNMYMGDLNFSFATFNSPNLQKGYKPMIILRAKFLNENLPQAVSCIKKLLFETTFDDYSRLEMLVKEQKQKLLKSLVINGNHFAVNYALSCGSERYKFSEMVTGIDYLNFLSHIETEKISQCLTEIKNTLFNKNNCIITYGCKKSTDIYNAAEDIYTLLGNNILNNKISLKTNSEKAVCINSNVNYNALVGNIKSFHGSYKVIKQIILSFIWDNIRLSGGAYGGSCDFYRSGIFKFSSHRDPNVSETFKYFAEIPHYVSNINLTQTEIDRYIIGAVSEADMPLKNNVKTINALSNFIGGITDDMLYEQRQQLLNCSLYDIQKYGSEISLENSFKTSVGNEQMLKQSKIYNEYNFFV